ncbi:MAG: hypothetical protein COU35_00300 [Candidatus Magasanikbacteria bacterium CG10_big_fil_rev_8_21_14_0_10_47_10]|uniref:Uncharacterized protein n=1 Tax=Candidatus Magasanikbacteria bacterium CG10_big_fil_rev_8_21_14_0_10_47_10 TaxID=1974652 RepID=A0A2H0TRP1_9BACT|nr:MAG: hypothetical protein COU35_00300 [Candidatus Magasanikbacteria bacterium CG10_big_fil_rev_8_21_14_0_10_47_10]
MVEVPKEQEINAPEQLINLGTSASIEAMATMVESKGIQQFASDLRLTIRDKKYIKTLEEQLEAFMQAGIPIDGSMSAVQSEAMDLAYSNFQFSITIPKVGLNAALEAGTLSLSQEGDNRKIEKLGTDETVKKQSVDFELLKMYPDDRFVKVTYNGFEFMEDLRAPKDLPEEARAILKDLGIPFFGTEEEVPLYGDPYVGGGETVIDRKHLNDALKTGALRIEQDGEGLHIEVNKELANQRATERKNREADERRERQNVAEQIRQERKAAENERQAALEKTQDEIAKATPPAHNPEIAPLPTHSEKKPKQSGIKKIFKKLFSGK